MAAGTTAVAVAVFSDQTPSQLPDPTGLAMENEILELKAENEE